MRHGTRQLSGKRARHGAGHRRVAGFYSASWPDIAPPLTLEKRGSALSPLFSVQSLTCPGDGGAGCVDDLHRGRGRDAEIGFEPVCAAMNRGDACRFQKIQAEIQVVRSEEHTSELQSR